MDTTEYFYFLLFAFAFVFYFMHTCVSGFGFFLTICATYCTCIASGLYVLYTVCVTVLLYIFNYLHKRSCQLKTTQYTDVALLLSSS